MATHGLEDEAEKRVDSTWLLACVVLRVLSWRVGWPRQMQGCISATFQFLSSCAYDVGQNSQDETITRTYFGSEEPDQLAELLEATTFTLSFSVQQLAGILGQLAHQ